MTGPTRHTYSVYIFLGIDRDKVLAEAQQRARQGDVVTVHQHKAGRICEGQCYTYEGDEVTPCRSTTKPLYEEVADIFDKKIRDMGFVAPETMPVHLDDLKLRVVTHIREATGR